MIRPSGTFQERRAFQRLPVRMPVRYQLEGEKETRCASSIDISPGGVGIFTDSPLRAEDSIIIWLKFLDGNGSLHISGKVVWSVKKMAALWRVGIRFDKPNFEYLQRLSYEYLSI